MLLDFKGTRVRVQIAKEEKYSSKHTDADLRRLEVRTTIQGEKNNEGFVELINQARTDGVTSVSEDGQVQRKWRLKNSSGSHRDNEPIFHHSIELDEIDYWIRESGIVNSCSVVKDDKIYTFLETAQPVDEEAIRKFVASRLPSYAVPSKFVELLQFPRNQNDKIDVKALAALLEE